MEVLEGFELTWSHMVWGSLFCLVSFMGSAAVLVSVLVRLPADYFRGPHPPPFWAGRHPVLRLAGLVAKNLLGALLIMFGIFLSVPGMPGQGLLTIFLGIMLLNFPRKRGWEQRMVSRPKVFGAISWIRNRFGKPLLLLDGDAPDSMAGPRDNNCLTRRPENQ